MALIDNRDPNILFRGAGGVNPTQYQASQDEKARTAMSLKESAQNIDFNKILLQQQQIAQQKAQAAQALNNVATQAGNTYRTGSTSGSTYKGGLAGAPVLGSPSTVPTAPPGTVNGPSGLLVRPGASGPDPDTVAPKYSQTAVGANGHMIGSNDGNTWFDAETGAPFQDSTPAPTAPTTLGDASQ
jgi:hypothetical protein